MSKSTTCCSVDTEVLEAAKHLNINISGLLNEALHHRVNVEEENVEGINIKIMYRERAKLSRILEKTRSKVQKCDQIIQKHQENMDKFEEEKLKREKLAIENQEKCQNCGEKLLEKARILKFPIGKICKSCYMTADSDKIATWNKVK